MFKILLILLLLLPLTTIPTNISSHSCLEMDIVLLGDMSGSMEGHEPDLIEAFSIFLSRFELTESGIKVGLVMFSQGADVYCQLTTNKQRLYDSMNSIIIPPQAPTNTADGLLTAYNELIRGRSDVKKMIILMTDGKPTGYGHPIEEAIEVSRLIQLKGIMICGIFIADSPDSDEEIMIQLTPWCYVYTNYELLPEELKRMDICL